VTNFVECSRLFGTLAPTKLVSGRVKEVIPGLQKDGRRKTDLRVAWVVQTRTVEKTFALRSVKAGSVPTLTPLPPPFRPRGWLAHDPGVAGGGCAAQAWSAPSPTAGRRRARRWGCLFGAPHAPRDSHRQLCNVGVGGSHGARRRSGGAADLLRAEAAGGCHLCGGGHGGSDAPTYHYFLAMFPMNQLTRMVRLTSPGPEGRGMQPTTRGELLKFIGVTILPTL